MAKIGAVFDPELIELMKSALDDAATMLPKAKRTPGAKVRLASRILTAAAKGERDPIQLRIAALLEIEHDQEDDIDRCYSQVLRLRKQVEQREAVLKHPAASPQNPPNRATISGSS